MSKNKSSKKVNELRESGKQIINQLGNEIINDNIEIDELKNKLNKEENIILEENDLINQLDNQLISDRIEIGDLKDEIVDDNKLINELSSEVINDKIEINELKDRNVVEKETIKDQGKVLKGDKMKIDDLKTEIVDNNEIIKLQRNELINDRIEINKLTKDVKHKEVPKDVKHKEVLTKKEIDIQNKIKRFVYIKEIFTIDPDVTTLYLLKVTGIDIRFFIDVNEAKKECHYMQKVIRRVIELGSDAKVEVKEIKTLKNTYYLLKIANKNIKVYTHPDEAQRIAGYMQNVVDAVLNITN